jgi:hypothetical protein
VPAEGLLQPPRAVGRGDLGVDEQRALARAVQPAADRGQVGRIAHRDPLEPEAAADRGDVGRREPHGIQRLAVRPEVVHLRPVGLVVVDDHHHRQPQPRDRLEFAHAHQRAAVAERGHREPVRPGDRGPDGRGQAEPDRLERLGEAEPRLVGDRQVHARVPHEVARIHRHGPLRGQQVVQRDRQRARVDPLAVALVLVRHVPPAHLLRDPLPQPGGPVPCRTRCSFIPNGLGRDALVTLRALAAAEPGLAAERVGHGARGLGHVAEHAEVHRPVGADRGRVVVHLNQRGLRRDQLAVPRRPHVQRAAPGHDGVGPADQFGRERRGEPAAYVQVPRAALEQPLGHRGSRQQRPARLRQPFELGGPAPGTPARDEHRPPGPA